MRTRMPFIYTFLLFILIAWNSVIVIPNTLSDEVLYKYNLVEANTYSGDSGFDISGASIRRLWDGGTSAGLNDNNAKGDVEAWVEFDFERKEDIAEARLYEDNGGNQVSHWKVMYWSGTDWKDIFPYVESNTSGWQAQTFDISTTKVRFYAKCVVEDACVSIHELKLCTKPSSIRKKTVIGCVGDSNTSGPSASDDNFYAWPIQLGKILGKEYQSWNLGRSGATLFKEGDQPWVVTNQYILHKELNPDISIIALGTNDSKDKNWKTPPNSPEVFRNDYLNLIQEFQAYPSPPEVYMLVPIKAFSSSFGIHDAVIKEEIRPILRELSKVYGIPVIDGYSATENIGHLMPDGIHLNTEGLTILAEKVASIIDADKPLITLDQNSLPTSYAEYRWYRNGVLITDASDAAYKTSLPGIYKVAVKISSSTDDIIVSNDFEVTGADVNLFVTNRVVGTPVAKDATAIKHGSFRANWEAVKGAAFYHLDVAIDPEFSQILPSYNNYTVVGTSQDITGLSPNTSYYYRVRAYNGSSSLHSKVVTLQTQKLLIVLMAGQSNMAGRGIYSQLSPADTMTYGNILSLNKDSVWIRAQHPLHWDKSEAAVGMGIRFARDLADKIGGDIAIGLVPCAAGGTGIDEWLNDSWFGYTGNYYLYTNLIQRARKASQSGDIIGMIWHQGESDASSDPTPYQEKLQTLFSKVRDDLNIPDMPIVAGELGPYLESRYTYYNQINAAINGLKTILPNCGVAKSTGLTANSDNIHFTAGSQIEFGKRYADVFYSILNPSITCLTSLTFNGGTLSPVFHPDITEYTCFLPVGTSEITPVVTYSGASVTGVEAVDVSSGSGVSTIISISYDGTKKKYVIHYVTGGDEDYTHLIVNNDLEYQSEGVLNPVGNIWKPLAQNPVKEFYGWKCDLSVLGGTSQGINQDLINYHGNNGCWIAGSAVLPELYEFYQIIDGDLPAGTYKVQCRLAVADNKRTSQRLFANNKVQYHGTREQYVSNQTEEEIASFANWGSHEKYVQEMYVYVTVAENGPLKIGIRTGSKRGDGTTAPKANPMWGWFKTDYFRLTKIDPAHASNADLAAITLSAGSLNFSPEVTEYNVSLLEGAETVTVFAVANFKDVTVSGTGTVDVSSGSGMSTIEVLALDDVTSKIYTIHYLVGNHSGIENVNAKVNCSVVDRNLIVSGTDTYSVFNLHGIKIADVIKNSPESPLKLSPGFYIVRTQDSGTIKIVVR